MGAEGVGGDVGCRKRGVTLGARVREIGPAPALDRSRASQVSELSRCLSKTASSLLREFELNLTSSEKLVSKIKIIPPLSNCRIHFEALKNESCSWKGGGYYFFKRGEYFSSK